MTNVHDILEKARAAGAKLAPSEASVLFASAVRHAAAQGATIRPHLVQIDDNGVLHVAPFDELAVETDPGYLAPELHGSDAPRKTDAGAQVFAAGALGYEILTGKRASGLPPGPELAGPLSEAVRAALAADRRERFPDLQRLQQAVEALQPRPPVEGERSILSGLRMRWTRPPPEKEALAKLIEKLHHLEEQVQLLGKAQGRLEAAQRETAEHLERFTEGEARLGKSRSRPSLLGPALLAAVIAVAGTIAVVWAMGNLGGIVRAFGTAPPRGQVTPPSEPAAPDGGVSEPPAREASPSREPAASPAPPEAASTAASQNAAAPAETRNATSPLDAGVSARAPPDAGASARAPLDAGAQEAADIADAALADAGAMPDASVATAETPRPAPTAPQAPKASPKTASAPPAAPTRRPSTAAAMQHALAMSQVRRGEAALEQGRADAALESFRAALETEGNNTAAIRGLGMAYAMQGNDQQALQAYQRYLRIAPSAPDAREIRKSIAELKARSRLGAGEK